MKIFCHMKFVFASLLYSPLAFAIDGYDPETERVYIPLVSTGAINYEVEMRHIGDLLFQVTTAIPTPIVADADTYDPNTGTVNMRLVQVDDKYYEVTLIHQGSLIFKATSAIEVEPPEFNNPTPLSEDHIGSKDYFDDKSATEIDVAEKQTGFSLNGLSTAYWSKDNISVCWVDTPAAEQRYRDWVREAVESSWELYTSLDFTGWGQCDDDNPSDIIIRVHDKADDGPSVNGGLGRNMDDMDLNFYFQNWNAGTSCDPINGTGTNAEEKREGQKLCIKLIAVHEFGHAIGLAHEQNRDDTPETCTKPRQGTDGNTSYGPWDLHSVMNYCNPVYGNHGELSDGDKLAIARIYPKQEFEPCPPGGIYRPDGNLSYQCMFKRNGVIVQKYMNGEHVATKTIYIEDDDYSCHGVYEFGDIVDGKFSEKFRYNYCSETPENPVYEYVYEETTKSKYSTNKRFVFTKRSYSHEPSHGNSFTFTTIEDWLKPFERRTVHRSESWIKRNTGDCKAYEANNSLQAANSSCPSYEYSDVDTINDKSLVSFYSPAPEKHFIDNVTDYRCRFDFGTHVYDHYLSETGFIGRTDIDFFNDCKNRVIDEVSYSSLGVDHSKMPSW